MKRMTQIFRNAISAIDLRDPLRHLPKHAPVIDFLKRLALDKIAADLADKQNHRRRILIRRMHADTGVGRTRPARDETDSRPPRKLAVGLRHERRAALLPAHDELKLLAHVIHRVQHSEITFARYAKRQIDAVTLQSIHQNLAATTHELLPV